VTGERLHLRADFGQGLDHGADDSQTYAAAASRGGGWWDPMTGRCCTIHTIDGDGGIQRTMNAPGIGGITGTPPVFLGGALSLTTLFGATRQARLHGSA
jgi:hypothetical protein